MRGARRAAIVAAALVPIAVALLIDPFARTGWTASWYVEHEGARVELARTTEHRLAFPNEQRPLARYVERWDFERFGMPSQYPPLDATLRARLHVPTPGRGLRVASTHRTEIRIDGRAIAGDEPVGPGWHRLEIDWRGALTPATSLELQWEDGSPVERAALVPLEGSWPPMRIWLWLFATLASLALAATVGWIERGDAAARPRRIGALATALVVLLGLGYRLFDYDVMPDLRENDDERFAMWDGWSIVEDGTTRGLTLWFSDYAAHGAGTIERPRYFDRTYHVVTPYFEHPPLMHVLVGIAGHLGGAREPTHVALIHARLVPIALSAITLLLMIALARRLIRSGPAPWLGALLWAVLPWIALQTRVVKEEAALTPLAVGAFLAFVHWRDGGRRTRDLVLAAVLAGACALAKVTGIAFLLALAMLVIAVGRRRDLALVLGVGLATSSLFAVWGAIIDWHAFTFAQSLQTGRPVHFNIFLRFFDDGLINHNIVGRGWLLFLWLACVGGVAKVARGDAAVLTVPLVTYLAAIALGSGTWTFGWYVTPMLPFLCIGAGRYLADLWDRPDLFRGALFVFVLLFYTLNFVLDPDAAKDPAQWSAIRRMITAVLALSLAPFALAQAFGERARPIARAGMVGGLVTIAVVSAIFVARYDEIMTTYHDFDRDRYFDR